jgi:ubiquinone biosynthesis monooxygenase Coq7
MTTRAYSLIDTFIGAVDSALQTLTGVMVHSSRPNPADAEAETVLNSHAQRKLAGLMRINHVGEVCAQALYQGQMLTARSSAIKAQLLQSAHEEVDHLAWCQERLQQLNSHVSYLNPFWYTASFMIGAIAGIAGDAISLGFLAETEYQVESHLTEHLEKLPLSDQKSRRILEQMRDDELHHAEVAQHLGAVELPVVVKALMRCFAQVMKTTAYWL